MIKLMKLVNKLNRKDGVTLTEVMLSVALLAIITIPLLGAVVSSVNNNTTSSDRTEAKALAEKVIGELKANAALNLGSYSDVPSGDFKYDYTVTEAVQGKVALSTAADTSSLPSQGSTFTYDADAAENVDFELVIDQGTDTSDDNVNATLKYGNNHGMKISLDIDVADKFLIFEIRKQGVGDFIFYKFTFGDVEKPFTPIDLKHIKLRVTYAENSVPSSNDQLKIFTNILSDTNFTVYIDNNKEAKEGVRFINKGQVAFNIVYMETGSYKYDDKINALYKIEVAIKKNDKVIYSTSSYVKK